VKSFMTLCCAIMSFGYSTNAIATCADPNPTPAVRIWQLIPDPPSGQTIRMLYLPKSQSPIRLELFKDSAWFQYDLRPGETEYLTWPGGTLSYTYEVCLNDAWQYLNPWQPDLQDIPGGASFDLRPTDASEKVRSSELTIAWGDKIVRPPPPPPPPPPQPTLHSYVVGLGNMTVFQGVARGPNARDTDYVTLTVEGPAGQLWQGTYGPNNVKKNATTNWALWSAPITVPMDGSANLKITWSAINKGHNANADAIKNALASAGDAIRKQTQQDQKNEFLGLIAQAFSSTVGWYLANCDTALFNQTVVLENGVLSGFGGHGLSPEQPDMLHAVYDYLNVQSPCDTGRYNLEFHLKRVN
jgi:hypothetical protein